MKLPVVPGFILDALIAISMLMGILVLMTALSSHSPADFTVFPTLLLVTTIYRLAVNVSTTRLILSEGAQADSALIRVFGTFVVGGGDSAGSYIIGIIIFLILTLVQILVITKGATRVSEVAARFALDSLPGKQLAIDSDLAAGYIDEGEARRRRESLQKEMSFYGAMDGASKFVQGDVRLGLIIIAINIVGGLVVGTTIHGETMQDALGIYTRFTIGDGLVSTIPALLISLATGVIVSRSVGDDSLPEDVRNQLLSNPNILYVVGAMLVVAGLIPGFPFLPMASIGGLLIWMGYRMENMRKELDAVSRKEEADKKEERKPESYLQHLRTEPLEVEIGYNLIPLVDPKAGGTLLDQISRLRKRFAMETGLIVPPVRIRDNMNLKPGEYAIKLQGSIIGSSELEPDKLMAIDTGRVDTPMEGAVVFKEPTYNLNAHWINTDQKADAEATGYDVVDPSTVIATHLSSIIQQNSSEIMGRQEVKSIVDSIREENPVVVDEVLTEKKISLGQIQAVLQSLLKENVSIRNMVKILETISNNADRTQGDPYLMTESVRQALRRQIVGDLIDDSSSIKCITVDPQVDRRLREGIHRDPEEGFVMALRPDFQTALRDALTREYQTALREGHHPIFLSSRAIRAGIFYIMERLFPARNFTVIAHEEIPPDVQVDVIGQVTVRQRQEAEEATAAT
ncbi:MAG: FHIPEP family type III secretion protein [Leptospiraceae bacterium]|nr:FHIPEP family type III secretion protein [Leptospiraceae bacterium]